MAPKKTKKHHASSPLVQDTVDTPSPVSQKRCIHVRTLKVPKLKAALTSQQTRECKACFEETKAEQPQNEDCSPLRNLYVCLHCGMFGCGDEPQNHAVQHYKKYPHHALMLDITKGHIWCYQCNTMPSEVPLLKECKAIILKRPVTPKALPATGTIDRIDKAKTNIGTKGSRFQYSGLNNLGNTCFFNSLMQAAASIIPLKEDVSSAVDEQMSSQLTKSFVGLMRAMWESDGQTISPSALFGQIAQRWKQFKGFRQQDSHELMRFLFDGMREEIRKCLRNDSTTKQDSPKTFVDRCFGGELVSIIVCAHCKKVSHSVESFLDLSLPIPFSEEPKVFSGSHEGKRKKTRMRAASSKVALNSSSKAIVTELLDDILRFVASGNVSGLERSSSMECAAQMTASESSSVMPLMSCFSASKLAGEAITLYSCLGQFMSVDVLDGDNRFACESCNRIERLKQPVTMSPKKHNSDDPDTPPPLAPSDSDCASDDEEANAAKSPVLREAYKRYLIKTTPRVLCLHLKRFEQTFARSLRKISHPIDFPMVLDLGPYVLPNGALESEQGEKQIDIPKSEELYDLYSIVCHSGGMGGGHYVAYARRKPTSTDSGHEDEWIYASDSRVRKANSDEVMAATTGAYILFYVKRNESGE